VKRCIVIFWSVILIFSALPASASAPYPQAYKYYMELGKLALDRQDYKEATHNFRRAQMVAPTEKQPTVFINLIKRLQDERIEPKPATRIFRPFKKSREKIVGEELNRFSGYSSPKPSIARDRKDHPTITQPPEKFKRRAAEPVTPKTAILTAPPKYILPPPGSPLGEEQNIVYLDDDLWQIQPGTLLRVELRKAIVLDAQNFKRHLIITPGFIEVQRIDKDRINVVAIKRGSTIFHVWDDTGRWTFNIEVILPIRKTKVTVLKKQSERYAEPFKITYSADWSSFYKGQELEKVKRENLNFLQRILLEGETPYGDYDSHVLINKFDESTEVTGYGVGLTDGKIGDFKDFSIRGFDIQKVFSPLSMPGQYMRGVLFEAEAFNNNLKYTYVHGRDRATFGFLAPDVLEKRESFVEGARITLFPHKENQYSINYARGYGDARESFLHDQVFSIEAQHRFKDILLSGELAYDETATALTSSSKYKGDDHDLTVNFRNLESDFTTVTSLPGNRGEVGGSIFWDWRLGDVEINTYLDLYRERFLPNPEAEDTINVDYSTTVDIPFSKTDRLRSSLYYTDTTGEISPRNNVRFNTTYTKRFPLGARTMTGFIGMSQQRSRFDLSPSSEYDRYSASSGLTVPLIKNLNYFVNYEHSWLYEEQSGDHLRPNVMNTGLNYSKKLADGWSMHSSFSYRNEENTEGSNSFLAGEDNITGSLGTTYRPNEDFEFFMDGRTRNVWAETEDRQAFNEIDVRAGIRTSWGLPFSWNPKGEIHGVIYKDLNENQRQDEEEAGIADVIVEVGKRKVTTNSIGYYHATVKAKSVEVKVDIDSIPDGFIFSTPTIVNVEIIPHKTQWIDFGLTTQSGVYGVVYYDQNSNGKPDLGDEFISKVKLRLDGVETAISDFEGTYSFGSVQPGIHQIGIDVNSLPIEYLPKIRLKNEIEISEGSTYVFHIPLDKVSSKDK